MGFDGDGFGHRLKTARTWSRLGVGELALQVGVSDEVIYELERGERKRAPRRPMLVALAQAVGQTPEWLLAGDTPPWETATTPETSSLLERARLQAVRLADEAEALAEILAEDAEQAASG